MKTPTHKALACLLALTLALCAAFFTSGCATSGTDAQARDIARDTAFELVTKVAVSEALKSDLDRAETVVLVTGLILDGITSQELTVPAAVDAAIKDLVLASDLTPGSKQAVLVLADRIKAHYLARIDAGQLAPHVTAPIKTIVGWVRTAAQDTLRYGGPQSYGLPPLAATAPHAPNVGAAFMTPAEPKPLDESLWGWLTDHRTRERYPLSLSAPPEPQRIDPKWHAGLRYMLAHPQ